MTQTELNWVDILIAQMMKLESAQFFDRLLAGSSTEDEIGMSYKVKQHFAAKKSQDAAKEQAAELASATPEPWRPRRQNERKTTEASRGASAGYAPPPSDIKLSSPSDRIESPGKSSVTFFGRWTATHDIGARCNFGPKHRRERQSATTEDVVAENSSTTVLNFLLSRRLPQRLNPNSSEEQEATIRRS